MDPKKENTNEEENVEKYFDEENYSTLVVGPEKFTTPKKMLIEDVVGILRSKELSTRDEALKLLKEQNAQQVLIDAIEDDDYTASRHLLVAACWESGLDFSKYIAVFLELAGDRDLMVSLEAITVLEQIENFESKAIIEEAAKILSAYISKKHPNAELMKDIVIRWGEIAEEM
ncbi:MAG: hypothetical protein K0S33_4086 [Bacteroidetes bacterium]|jgi:hypothetical protein|nr:hypothetical protein [Bacteroidota bacterium]